MVITGRSRGAVALSYSQPTFLFAQLPYFLDTPGTSDTWMCMVLVFPYNLLNVVIDSVDKYGRVKRCVYTHIELEIFNTVYAMANFSFFLKKNYIFLWIHTSVFLQVGTVFQIRCFYCSLFHCFLRSQYIWDVLLTAEVIQINIL